MRKLTFFTKNIINFNYKNNKKIFDKNILIL